MEIFRQITANNIKLKEYPFLKELAMEAYLIENEDILRLDTEDFADVTVLDAEIALKSGRKTSNRDGRIDILAKYGLEYLAIVELKINEINDTTLLQLEDYLNVKNELLASNPDFWTESDENPKWAGVLVGTSISPELQRKLQNGYVTESGIPIAGMIIRRFRNLKNEIFVTTDTFFKYNYTSRDFSKFEFKGELYKKSPLVNKVIKSFVEENPEISYAELERLFPPKLQGSNGVFDTSEKAREIYNTTGHKRHYFKSDEIIKLSDSIIATSTQWKIGNIVKFVDHVNKMTNDFNIVQK